MNIFSMAKQKKIEADSCEMIKNNLSNELDFFNSIVQSIYSALLVVDLQGKVIYANNKFGELWEIPQKIIDQGDDKKLLKFVTKKLANPKEFIDKVNYLYKHNRLESSDEILFKKGQIIERISLPHFDKNNKVIGRVWNFRDVTEQKKAQAALVLSEQKYRRLFEAAKDGILILDAETGEIREVNPYLIEMLGYSRKEFLQKKLWQIGFFRDIVASKESFEELKSKGYVHYEDLPLRTKAGKAIHVEFVSNVYGIDHTNVVQCNIRDITARYRAETALASNELRFRAIYENSPVPIFMVGLDGKFLSVNSASEKMLGYSQKELQKLAFADITHPDEVKRDVGKIKELISGKISTYNVEKRYIRKDEQIVYVSIYVTLIRDASKKPLYFLTIAEDITNHHEYLAKIRQSEIKYSTLVENSNDAVLVIQDGLYVFANKSSETITGYKAKDVLGKPLMDFVAPKHKKIVSDMYTRRMKGEQVASRYEFDVVKKDGSLLTIEVSSSVVEYGGRPAVMAIIRDMTKAKEIDRIKSEFIAVASHQLRTPLTGIKWYSQLLLADKAAPLTETQKDYMTGIFDSNERMIKLVNDLLDVSHIETGHKFSVVKKNIDIITVIKRVVGSNTICNGICGIKIELDKKMPSRLAVPIDEKKIEQVFINLLNNAVKYSGKGKKIIISASRIGGEAYFSVKDFGLGIPKRQQHRIFEKFFRADNIATTSQEGTGLGLYIAKSIVEAHGGKINLESKENKGTTFYFTLPLK